MFILDFFVLFACRLISSNRCSIMFRRSMWSRYMIVKSISIKICIINLRLAHDMIGYTFLQKKMKFVTQTDSFLVLNYICIWNILGWYGVDYTLYTYKSLNFMILAQFLAKIVKAMMVKSDLRTIRSNWKLWCVKINEIHDSNWNKQCTTIIATRSINQSIEKVK